MSLSPWPTSPAALSSATSTLKDAISPGSSNEYIQRLGATASAIIEKYARDDTPDPVRDEALIRLAGYLHETGKGGDFGATRSKGIDLDSVKLDQQTNPAPGAFRRSGAMSLLSPWRERAGVTA